MEEQIIKLTNLKIDFQKKGGPAVPIIKGIDLFIPKGKIVGIVGESGSGKSVTMKSLMGILPDNALVSYDKFLYDDQEKALGDRKHRVPASMIFQDPMTSLNPLRTIGYHLVEVIQRTKKMPKNEAHSLAVSELTKVGIPVAEKRMDQYPHELSGGMRQRVMIAMALLAKPDLLIADEPTTALDVTIQAQILFLLKKLKEEENLSVVLVTHDFGIVAGMCEFVKVMYQGVIVEEGTVDDIFYNPQHIYTKELLKAIPNVDSDEPLYSMSHTSVEDILNSDSKMVNISSTHRVLMKEEVAS